MEEPIAISKLNDFIFCPISIYFHNLFYGVERSMYQSEYQINGTAAHSTIDNGGYSTSLDVLQAIPVYSEKYNLYGKIDIYNKKTRVLVERKKKIKKIYDGYIFQIYGQYFALCEMGYNVSRLELYSMDDNTTHLIPLPKESSDMYKKFIDLLESIRSFELDNFVQNNIEKCQKCIYSTLCDRTLFVE